MKNPKIYPGPRDRNEGGEKNKEPGSGFLVLPGKRVEGSE